MYGYLFEIKFINKKDKSTTTTTTAATVEGPLFKYKKKKKSIMVIYNFCNGCGTLKTKML